VFSRHNPHLRDNYIVTNVAFEAFIVKQEVLVSSSHFPSLNFIDLSNFSNEDVRLPMSDEHECFWFIVDLDFKCVPCGRRAFKL
jgi:hypothetical protein